MPNNLIKTISITEMVGGIGGVLLSFYVLFTNPLNVILFFLFLLFLAINFLSFSAGMLLWRGHKLGKPLSIITQLIHLPKISSVPLTFMFSFGFDLYPYLLIIEGTPMWGIEFRVLSSFQVFINNQNAPFGFGFSIVAIAFLIILFLYRKEKTNDLSTETNLPPTPDVYSDIGGKADLTKN